MSLISDLITNALGGMPSKPDVPSFPTITAGGAQSQALTENLAALPGIESLASQTNLFNEQQIQSMLKQFIPGYGDITKTASGNILSELEGKIPGDVSAAVTESAAARALTGGFGGTEMAGDLLARDLGLTSLDLTNRGLAQAEGWIGLLDRVASPGTLNVASMFISPGQELAQENLAAEQQFNVNWLKNQIAALPDPATAAIARDVGDLTGNLAPSFMGGTPGGVSDVATGSSMLASIGGGGGGGGGGMMGALAGGIGQYEQNQNALTGLDTAMGGWGWDYGNAAMTGVGGAAAAGGGL